MQVGLTILQDFQHRLTSSLTGSISQALHASLQCQRPHEHVPGMCGAGACTQQQRPFSSDSAAEPDQGVGNSPHSNAANSMDFPGGRVPFTDQLTFVGGAFSPAPPMSCYRTLDSTGARPICADALPKELPLRMSSYPPEYPDSSKLSHRVAVGLS